MITLFKVELFQSSSVKFLSRKIIVDKIIFDLFTKL